MRELEGKDLERPPLRGVRRAGEEAVDQRELGDVARNEQVDLVELRYPVLSVTGSGRIPRFHHNPSR